MKKVLLAITIFSLGMARIVQAQAPSWQIDSKLFQHSMNVFAEVSVDAVPSTASNLVLGAFVGGELRGTSNQSTLAGGKRIYFLTVFSNQFSGETVEFQIHTPSDDQIHPAWDTAVFERNKLLGNGAAPFALRIYAGDDFPIVLNPIPPQTKLAGQNFLVAGLNGYLFSSDGDPVVWSAVPSAAGNLTTALLPGNNLQVSAVSGAWTGTDSVLVTATESGTTAQHSSSRWAKFTVLPNFNAPTFSSVPNQSTCEDTPFPNGNLSSYLSFSGACISYFFNPQPPTGTAAAPVWEPAGGASGSMALTLKVKFGSTNFTGTGLKLAAFRGTTLVGTATPQVVAGENTYFLTASNVGEGDLTFKFYDGGRQYLHNSSTEIAFVPSASQSAEVQVAPIFINQNASTGQWSVSLLQADWYGTLQARAQAIDCDDPLNLATAFANFTRLPEAQCQVFDWFQDADSDTYGNPAIKVTATPALAPAGYVLNNTDCNDTNANINPGKTEVCNDIDDNCAGGIDEGFTQFNAAGTSADVTCFGLSNGSISQTITAGVAPFGYLWNDNQTTKDRTGLAAGIFSVTITAANGCTKVKTFSIQAPATAIAVTHTKIDNLCFGSSAGTIFSTPTGGTSPYTYLWSNGKTTKDVNLLAANTYTQTTTDSKGCTKSTSTTITQPTAVNFTLASSPAGGTTHNVTVTASGGVPAYSYNKSPGSVYQTSHIFNAVPAGNVIFKVKDANNCIKSRIAKVPITTPGQSDEGNGGGKKTVWDLDDEQAALPDSIIQKMFDVRLAGKEMLLFPNPATDEVSLVFSEIQNSRGEMAIFDAVGRLVSVENLQPRPEELLRVQVGFLPRGVYTLRWRVADGAVFQQQFLKI